MTAAFSDGVRQAEREQRDRDGAMLRRPAKVDHRTLLLNLLLLLSVCLLPFSTALMADCLKAAEGERVAAAIYGGSFLLMSVLFFAMQFYALRRRP